MFDITICFHAGIKSTILNLFDASWIQRLPMRPAVSMICEMAARVCMFFQLQLSVLVIFVDHYLGQITALVTIFAVCLLS